MTTKVNAYMQMADSATRSLTAQIRDWSRFLIWAGKFYKYKFLDQVMIYTQRPDATACAGFDLWTRRMGRRIRRGSKGIALLCKSDGRTVLRYVFDVTDTERLENALDPMPWVYREEYRGAVISRLEKCFNVSGREGLDKQLISLAVQFSKERWHDFKQDLMYSVKGSLLEGLDEDNISMRFQAAVTVSLAFLLLGRCGFDLDSYFSPEDFDCIREFNTREAVLALGNAVTESAGVILRQIEYVIRKSEQAKSDGSSRAAALPVDKHLTTDGLPISSPTDAGAAAGESTPAAAPFYFSEPEPPAHNFRITDDHLGDGGPKAKYRMNVAAIRTLKQIEADGRNASLEEQDTLSQYVGWGGVADAFEPDKPEWAAEYTELKALLTDEEYSSARASTLNSHYTPPVIIRTIYDALDMMGFTAGNVLEPSCGVGNFFGLLPERMAASKLYGVELDSLTGRIAKLLYPTAHIDVQGYESSRFPNDFFDVAVGNVPFGQYKVNDPAYNRYGFSIHNYFLCKALDQLRPGGIMAIVTSRYTMDSKDTAARKYLAERADLLGAVRLPNSAFKANAGTDVVSDILFLQKRDEPRATLPDWVNTTENTDGYPVNSYFVDNPEMVLGLPGSESTRYGQDYTVYPIPGVDLSEQLREAITRIHATYRKGCVSELDEEGTDSIPADPDVKNFSYTLVNGAVYYRENSVMARPKLSPAAAARITGMVRLRDCVRRLISLQMEEHTTDSAIRAGQEELNRLYDGFTREYGLINDRANRLAFDKDASYYLLCSLEILDDNGKLERKADIFTRRTINRRVPVTHVDTAQEALTVSIGERARVDLPYMARLTGKTEQELTEDLSGAIYKDPLTSTWQTADEYLSGNVRRKLSQARQAAERDPAFKPNVDALLSAQPKDLEAGEIEVRLGATWIAPEYIQQFMYETFQTPKYQQEDICVVFVKATAAWSITNKSQISDRDVVARTTYGTDRYNAYEILEETLNLRDVRVYDTVEDPDGKERRVINSKQTTLAAQKQQMIKDAFRDWIWKDPERRQTLVRLYNDTMNCIRPREYDGSHIVFHGINPSIQLRPHQLGAIAHVLYGGNTLLAHEVGAGKSFEMIAAAMESKNLGLCSKSIFVVPNHLTQQMASEFLRLYPAANILVTTKRDFEAARRKKFCARIATGDWDAVIIGHSQFEKIPVSFKRQEQIIEEQIDDITDAISEVKESRGERFTIKQMEKLKKSLLARLDKLKADWKKDSVISFEQLGVDMMFVDESDMYKNLFLYTKMRNVAGLSTAEAQKSSDMFAKCRYIDEITHGRGIVMATGTPISNSMTELFTIQRYLQYDRLQEMGMGTFDSWASRFGETVTALELAPEGYNF